MLIKNNRYDNCRTICHNISSDINVDTMLYTAGPEHIWISADYHLYTYDKDAHKIVKNPDYNEIFYKHNRLVNDEEDIFIFLGDLVDDECQCYTQLAQEFAEHPLHGAYKIFILGNNDLQPESYYIDQLGFDSVYYAYQYGPYVFSHMPLTHHTGYNIHGHIHQYWNYGYNGASACNKMKVYTKDHHNAPITLQSIITLWNQGWYAQQIAQHAE